MRKLKTAFSKLKADNGLENALDPVDSIRHMAPSELTEASLRMYAMIQEALANDQHRRDSEPFMEFDQRRNSQSDSVNFSTLIPSLTVDLPGFLLSCENADSDDENPNDTSGSPDQSFKMSRSARSSISVDGYECINEWMIIDQIGQGQCGRVVLAIKDGENDPRAIKIIPRSSLLTKKTASPAASPKHSASPLGSPRGFCRIEFNTSGDKSPKDKPVAKNTMDSINSDIDIETVQREVAIMKKLRHKNIVPLYEVIDDEEEGNLYLVMQYVDQGPLFKLDGNGRCEKKDHETVRNYMRQILSGLSYLERNNVLHMDIKPDNILLSSDGTVFLADFGMSEVMDTTSPNIGNLGTVVLPDRPLSARSVSSSSRSMTPRPVQQQRGTPAFMSPEMCRGEDTITSATDIWSLGVTLYCMLCGELPFKGGWREMTRKILEDDPPYPDDLDDVWLDILHGMLHKDPEQRCSLGALRRHPLFSTNRIGGDPSMSRSFGSIPVMTPRDSCLLEISTADVAEAFTQLRTRRHVDRPRGIRGLRLLNQPNGGGNSPWGSGGGLTMNSSVGSLLSPKMPNTGGRTPTSPAPLSPNRLSDSWTRTRPAIASPNGSLSALDAGSPTGKNSATRKPMTLNVG